MSQLTILAVLAVVLAGSPISVHAQLSAGGLATAPETAAGTAPGGAAAAPLTAQSIAGSITGSSLGTISTGEACPAIFEGLHGAVFVRSGTVAASFLPYVMSFPRSAFLDSYQGMLRCVHVVGDLAIIGVALYILVF